MLTVCSVYIYVCVCFFLFLQKETVPPKEPEFLCKKFHHSKVRAEERVIGISF